MPAHGVSIVTVAVHLQPAEVPGLGSGLEPSYLSIDTDARVVRSRDTYALENAPDQGLAAYVFEAMLTVCSLELAVGSQHAPGVIVRLSLTPVACSCWHALSSQMLDRQRIIEHHAGRLGS